MLDLTLLAVNNFCESTANIWQVIGWAMTIFKIVIPLLLIIFGMVDLGKAVVSSKDDEIKKATMALAKRAIAGIVIFFIPTLVSLIISLVEGKETNANGETIGTWEVCRKCITNPGGDCAGYADTAWNQ